MSDVRDKDVYGGGVGGCAYVLAAGLILLFAGPTLLNWVLPPPLGRTSAAVDRTLDRALPPGTTADSAAAYLRRRHVYLVVTRHGRLEIYGEEFNVHGDLLLPTNISFTLVFDSTDRLVQHTTTEYADGP